MTLTVSRDQERDKALADMLGEGGSLANCKSVMVLCTARGECGKLAKFINSQLPATRPIGKQWYHGKQKLIQEVQSKLSTVSEPYHAGLTEFKRKNIKERVVEKTF